jgi:diguanylate cyclase (GGDEF)-like protein
MQNEPTDERRVFLSTEFATRTEGRFALLAVLVSVTFFFAALPFATRPLGQVEAFIPAYEATLVLSDLITAAMLFAQFNVLRSPALFVLANGYLFTAFIAVSHALTFPGLFSASGLLGAGPQSTAWLYMFWHAGFPLFVIIYALLKTSEQLDTATTDPLGLPYGGTGIIILIGVVAVLALVCGLAFVATASHDVLAVLMSDNRFTPAMKIVVTSVWLLSFFALALLWWRRPHTVLDLWLMAVMCAWLCDIALSAVLNAGRFDLGWYGGRTYGLLAANFLLIVLLIENATHYARLGRLSAQLSVANKSLEQLSLKDGLTNIANRRSFDTYLAGQIAVAHRYKRTLALVLCDVDSFKTYNDQYGHQAGDECLKQVAAALQSCCRRPADMTARYGGEEFAMILPDTELIGAGQIAEAARRAVAELKIPHACSSAGPYVSISGGVAVLVRGIDITAQQLITAADQILYEAKHLGRNRIISVHAEAV